MDSALNNLQRLMCHKIWTTNQYLKKKNSSPVGWGCRIHCRGLRPLPLNKCPEYDIKPFDGEAPVMLELWWMWSTLSLPSLLGLLLLGVVAHDRILSMGQWLMLNWVVRNRTIWSLTVCKHDKSLIEFLVIASSTWNHVTVCKMSISLFKKVSKIFTNHRSR